jgi:acyl-CoA synthetase (NDP forming)/GNAT superfamily N-acetyltransferase
VWSRVRFAQERVARRAGGVPDTNIRCVSEYPSELERPGLLKDGRSVLIRPIRADDVDGIVEMYGRLSRRSISYRFLGPVITIRHEVARRFTEIDYVDDLALVALLGERILGEGRITRSPSHADRAEVTFVIEDAYQGQGLGGLLLEHIAAAARQRGISTLEANVLADNLQMISAFTNSGYPYTMSEDGSIVRFDIALIPRGQVINRGRRRDHETTRSSLVPLMAPTSVAVIGASRRPATIGSIITRNLLQYFVGDVHLVNPNLDEIEGQRVYPSVLEIPGSIDLAIIAVPAARVLDVLEQCAEKAVKVALVVSIGFSESGVEGRARESEMVRFARQNGIRILGPNCMGVINNAPTTQLAATFAVSVPKTGRVSICSQSGTIGLALLDRASRYNLGCSAFVSLGNASDIGIIDLLQWWDEDTSTDVILLHTDDFENPREFSRLARRVSPRKPIVAVHPGVPQLLPSMGVRPSGHVSSDSVLSQLFRQAGVIRARRQEELFDLGLVLAHQPVPDGPNVAIVSNGAGPGQLTAGACRANGLRPAELSEQTRERLDAILPPHGDSSEIVDLTPLATPEMYAEALDLVLHDGGVDAVIVVFVPPLANQAEGVAAALLQASADHPTKTVVASFLGEPGIPDALIGESVSVPSFTFPETAAETLGELAVYGQWRRQPAGVQPNLTGIRRRDARSLVANAEMGTLDPGAAAELLRMYGIDTTVGDEPDTYIAIKLELLEDATFGPVLTLGVAGPYMDLFDDVAFRITPLTDRDATEMVQSLRSFPMLSGAYEGGPYDLDALEGLLLRVSAMVEDLPELAEMEFSEIHLGVPGVGARVVDARIVVAAADRLRIPLEHAVVRRELWGHDANVEDGYL